MGCTVHRVVAIVALTLLCLLAGRADAAPRTLRGVVVEAGTPSPIAGASVLTDRGAIAVTDVDGYFALTLEAADRDVTVAAPGFATRSLAVPTRDPGVWRIDLERAAGAEVIEVTGRAPEQTRPLSYQLTADDIRALPGAGNDILRAIQALPGVARIPFSFGGLVLRGMSPRDTTVLLDGVEVPLAFHFGGVTSFYPGGMLADLTLTSGGFDASVGRTQGGVVALTTREPRTDRWRVGGAIGLLDSTVNAEGPLPGGGGVILGVRRSYVDTIVAPFVEEGTPLPSYWDVQLRTGWGDPRRHGRITPMIFTSIDRVSSDEVAVTSSFVRVAAPVHRQWGPTTLHVVPWGGWNQLTFEDKQEAQTFSRPTFVGGVRAEVVHDRPWGHVRGGGELHGGYLAQTAINLSDEDLRGSSTVAWTDVAGWGEVRYALDGERFAIKPGVRVEVYGLTGELVIDPRLNIHQQLTERLTLRQAFGRFHQPPTPGDVDPNSGNPALDSSHVDQLSLGLDARLPASITASVTGYYHHGDEFGVRVRSMRPGADAPEPNLGGLGPTFELLLEKQLGFAIYRENLGRARSLGAEVLLKRSHGPWFTMLGYTLAIAERTDDPRARTAAAIWRPFELDQRHNLQLAVSHAWSKWRLGARLQVVSGNPYSPSRREGATVVRDSWGGRLPTFVALDLRVDRRWHRCWGDINLYLDVQNALNRRNVEGRDYDFDDDRDEDLVGLPLIPFLGVEFLPLR